MGKYHIALLMVLLLFSCRTNEPIVSDGHTCIVIDYTPIVINHAPYESGPIRIRQDVAIHMFMPFLDMDNFVIGINNNLALLNRPASLRLYENLPRLDGATALYPVFAAFVQAVYPKMDFRSYFPTHGIVRITQTPRAFENLINGEVDIIFTAEPSREQIAQAGERGIEFNMTPIGKDGFVFFVNKNNPINDISSEQIRGIYSGKITNWEELGWEYKEIIAFQRPEGSGSQTILESIMGNIPIIEPPIENRPHGMGQIIDQVADYTNYINAIGFSFRFFTTEMVKNKEIKLLSVDGVMPTRETILSNKYEFAGTFYATTTGNESDNTRRFIDWILSEEGQYLIERTGYIPIR